MKSITALVSVTALPLPSLYVNVTVLLVASYLYTLVPPDAVPPLFSVEPVLTAVGAMCNSEAFNVSCTDFN